MIDYLDYKIRLKFNGGCLKQLNKLSYTHSTIVNIFIVYKLGASGTFSDDSILRYSLFGAVKLTKDVDADKYQYSGYEIGFDKRGSFSLPSSGFSQNVIIFGAFMNSSVLVDNKKNDILIIGKGLTHELGEHS